MCFNEINCYGDDDAIQMSLPARVGPGGVFWISLEDHSADWQFIFTDHTVYCIFPANWCLNVPNLVYKCGFKQHSVFINGAANGNFTHFEQAL